MIKEQIKLVKTYLENEFKNDLKRLNHINQVVKAAKSLAKTYQVDEERVELACLLHDATKNWPAEKTQAYAVKLFSKQLIKDIPQACLHSFSAASLAYYDFHIQEQEIIEAIAYHCTAKTNMSLLAKIVYIADYIEEGRNFANEEIKAMVYTDLEKAFYLVLINTANYLKKMNLPLAKLTKEVIKDQKLGGFNDR